MGNLAPRPGSSSIASPRALELHWGTSTQRIKFYPHGSLEDLLAGIRGVMGVAEDAPLRFRDAEGDIVLLAPAGARPGPNSGICSNLDAPYSSSGSYELCWKGFRWRV